MKRTLDSNTNITGMHIALIRKAHHLTQAQFARRLSDQMGRPCPLSVTTISAIESGRKRPSLDVLLAIAELYGVSVDYLLGLSEEKDRQTSETQNTTGPVAATRAAHAMASQLIPPSRYRHYHNQPVFVTYPNKTHADQWGILDAMTDEIVFPKDRISYTDTKVVLYAMEPYRYNAGNPRSAQPIPIGEFLQYEDHFWVELKTADPAMRALYDGYYTFGANHQSIINVANGEVLPVSGFGISYTAYREPYDN